MDQEVNNMLRFWLSLQKFLTPKPIDKIICKGQNPDWRKSPDQTGSDP
jgi:hypothetical protein